MSARTIDIKTTAALTLLLLAGLMVRLALAPQTAHPDTLAVRSWMESSVKLGLARSYREQVSTAWLPNYPPLAIAVLEGSGYLYKWIVSPSYVIVEPAHLVFAKLPAIAADLVIGTLLFFIVTRLRSKAAGLLAAAIYLFHPAVLFDSTVWGQTDALYVVFLLPAALAYCSKRPVLGMVLALVSCLVKVQALMLLPVFLFLLPLNANVLLKIFNRCLAILIIVVVPFVLAGTLTQLVHVYVIHDVLRESHAMWQAYNIWLILLWPEGWQTPGTTTFFGVITYDQASYLLFAALSAMTLWRFRKRLRGNLAKPENIEALFYVLSFLSLLVFMIGTEMHERYLFPFVVFGLPLAFRHRRYAVLYACVSFCFFLNLLGASLLELINTSFLQSYRYLPIWIAAAQMFALVFYSIDVMKGLDRQKEKI